MKDLKIGMIGCGGVAESCHLPAARSIPSIRIKAISDIHEEHARHVAERFGLKETSFFSDYRRLLKESDVDAVWVLTPPILHAQIVTEALRDGKHVLCEKPLATSTKETEVIRSLLEEQADNSDRPILMPAHNFIFTPCLDKALELVKEGKIGKIKEIRGRSTSNLTFYKAKTEFRTQAKGGVIEDQLPHVVYVVQDLGGSVEKVIGVEPHGRSGGVAQDVDVVTDLKGGIDATLSAAWSGFIPTFKLDVIGDSGVLSMDLLRTPYNLAYTKGGKSEKIQMGRRFGQYFDVLKGKHPSYFLEHLHFVKLANGEVYPRVVPEAGFALVDTLESIMKVVDEHRKPSEARSSRIAFVTKVEDDVEKALRTLATLSGGLNIKKGALTIVKPNICSGRNPENMVTTDPRVIEAALKMIREKTDNVLVVESDNNSGTAENRLSKTGVLDIVEKCGAQFINLSKDEYEEREVSGSVVRVPRTILRADYFLNLPKVKTCNIENSFVSIAMKNMFGLLADRKKVQFHKNLVDVLLYLNRTIRQDMIIADGITAMEGLGPVWGNPVPLNVIVSGFNPVTVDAVCCHIMGINPYAVGALWKAYKSGMGEIDIDHIEVLGEKLEKTRKKFAYPVFMTKNITGAIRTAFKTYL